MPKFELQIRFKIWIGRLCLKRINARYLKLLTRPIPTYLILKGGVLCSTNRKINELAIVMEKLMNGLYKSLKPERNAHSSQVNYIFEWRNGDDEFEVYNSPFHDIADHIMPRSYKWSLNEMEVFYAMVDCSNVSIKGCFFNIFELELLTW